MGAKKRPITASTMKIEFIAHYEASNHGIWPQSFVIGLQTMDRIERSLKLFFDNKSLVIILVAT